MSTLNNKFEDNFRNEVQILNKEYIDLITTNKIKKENEKEKDDIKKHNQSVVDVTDYLDNDSDVEVIGHVSPKPVDVITLNENGDELTSSQEIKTYNKSLQNDKDDKNDSIPQISEPSKQSTSSEINDISNDKSSSDQSICNIEEDEPEDVIMEFCPIPHKWNREMIELYTKNKMTPYEMKIKIQNKIYQDNNPNLWRVDKTYFRPDFSSKFCSNCGMRTHDDRNCPKPDYNTCPMCSQSGHSPENCTETQCLNCGKTVEREYLYKCDDCQEKIVLKIKCEACKKLYHSSDQCPHLWRCLEFTPRKGKIKTISSKDNIPNPSRYCSNCAGPHLIEDCPHLSNDHPLRQDNSSKIIMDAYEKYDQLHKIKINQQQTETLLSEQGTDFLQKLSSETQINIEFIVDEKINIILYKSNPVISHLIKSKLKRFLLNS